MKHEFFFFPMWLSGRKEGGDEKLCMYNIIERGNKGWG